MNFSIASGQGNRITAVIFDVEGTLVDCVPQTLASWRETLADFGCSFSVEELQRFSGMDGRAMLDVLLRDKDARKAKSAIINAQGER